jgi:hypothetical protein
MNLEELKSDKKRRKDGVLCVVDVCHAVGKGKDFETDGEFCSECDCGFDPEQLEVEEINFIRIKYGEQPLTEEV